METMTGTVASRPASGRSTTPSSGGSRPTGTPSHGVHPGRYQPAWYSVDVPKTGTTIRVNGFGKKGNQINLSVN